MLKSLSPFQFSGWLAFLLLTVLPAKAQEFLMLEDISASAAQYHLIALQDGGLLLRNAGGDNSSVELVKLNNQQEAIWFRGISNPRMEEKLFHYSLDEEFIYFFFERRRGFRTPEFMGRRNRPLPQETGIDNTLPEQADQNGLSVRYVRLSNGEFYERFFPTNNPINFLKADVSWPNVMAYGQAFDRKILFNANFLTGESNLISLNKDLYEDVHILSALPKSGGRFAIGLSNRADELYIMDVDGLRPRLTLGGDTRVFLQAKAAHAPYTGSAARYVLLTGRYKGNHSLHLLDLDQGLDPISISGTDKANIRQNDLEKGRVETTKVLKKEDGYILALIHKRPYKTWFQNMDPFWDYSTLMNEMRRRSPGNREAISRAKPGFFDVLRDQLAAQPSNILASEQAPIQLADNIRELDSEASSFASGSPFPLSFNPVLRLLSRKNVYSPLRQDGFSIMELDPEGKLVKASYFKQNKEKIADYKHRVALNFADDRLQILAAESDGIVRYNWEEGTRTLEHRHLDSGSYDERGFERVAFIGNHPVSIWADFFNLGKGQGFSTTSTHKVEFYMQLGN
jgi:hypothetical protein